jgi:hypothetical protein
MGLAFFKD